MLMCDPVVCLVWRNSRYFWSDIFFLIFLNHALTSLQICRTNEYVSHPHVLSTPGILRLIVSKSAAGIKEPRPDATLLRFPGSRCYWLMECSYVSCSVIRVMSFITAFMNSERTPWAKSWVCLSWDRWVKSPDLWLQSVPALRNNYLQQLHHLKRLHKSAFSISEAWPVIITCFVGQALWWHILYIIRFR